MDIKRKYRPTKFQKEIYEDNIGIWVKQQEMYEELMAIGVSDDAKEYVNEAYDIVLKQIEKYNAFKSANHRVRRDEYPIKRLRKLYRNS